MNVINSVMTALLDNYPPVTVLSQCFGILCQISELDWFLETCETPLKAPLQQTLQCHFNQSYICLCSSITMVTS